MPKLSSVSLVVAFFVLAPVAAQEGFLRFQMEEINKQLKVGYAVSLSDVDGDGKKDIVVVDTNRVIWFQNPSWKLGTIIQGQTKEDNVCIDPFDIDGDGKLDFALGADWKPFNTKEGSGTLQWLQRGKSSDERWAVIPIDTEPTTHRIRFADFDGDGRPYLINGPLMGRNSTKEKNWMDGPIRITAYKIPKNPAKDRWVPEIIDNSLHVMHNFQAVDVDGDGKLDLLTASYEGVNLFKRSSDGKWSKQHIGAGNQTTPQGNRGASEIKLGRLKDKQRYIATIEPWHGFQVVVYTAPKDPSQPLWTRHVIDDQLKWGHAVWCADLDGDGDEELIIGVRDNQNDQSKSGVRIYKARDLQAGKWDRQIVEHGGVAVEDLAAADLNGDGKIDIVAVGRATGNVRIYWNETK
jgi:hypothetical protein